MPRRIEQRLERLEAQIPRRPAASGDATERLTTMLRELVARAGCDGVATSDALRLARWLYCGQPFEPQTETGRWLAAKLRIGDNK